MLRPLRRETLRAVIEGPAALAGIGVEEELIPGWLMTPAPGRRFLSSRTRWQSSPMAWNVVAAYSFAATSSWGVQAALTRQADDALRDAVAASGRTPDEVIKSLLRLVTVDDQGRPVRWRVCRDELSAPMMLELDAFVARRLLTTDTENGNAILGVAHEAFLSTWPPLIIAITAAVSSLRARRAVEHAAAEWSEDEHRSEHLWEHGQLAAAVNAMGAHLVIEGAAQQFTSRTSGQTRLTKSRLSLLRHRQRRVVITERVELSASGRDFLRASILRDRRRRRRGATRSCPCFLCLH